MPSGVFKRTASHCRNIGKALKGKKRSRKAVENVRRALNRPEVKRRHHAGLVRAHRRPKYKRLQRAKMRRMRKDPKFCRKLNRALDKSNRTRKFRSMVVKIWKSPSHRRKMAHSHRTTIARKNYSISSKKMHQRPEMQEFFGAHMKAIRAARDRKGPSKIQLFIFRSLLRRGMSGLRLEHVVGSKSIDIALPKKRLAIEIDGAYWHRNKATQRKRDRYLKVRGWRVLHFPAKRSSIPKILEMAA
jgi:very-short-patch-repair endonuclease